ncbi:PREDICTED: GDNF family receptor alpha-like, partial [Calidris pugnax]|uniref:GDNF family receptor alpha-like n=1 Tax=Calidris pugnax TaxID=198806 RepID=UPI00071DDD8F
YTANRTCLDVNKECVEDEVCNKQLSLYLKVCSVNKKCDMEECQAAIRFFYQNMPFEVAQMMTFCDCVPSDESCHRAKDLLHAYTANRTCLDVNKECVEDEVCNKQLSLYLKVCSVNKKCDMEECQAAIRFFYQNMPFEVAQMMTFCDCVPSDESCHRAKDLLHGKPCAVTAVPPPSCLNVIHMCEENELCRKKYTAFRSKCWRHMTKKCYDDEACLETLIKDDIPCSANADCKAAYISNWGTMLRVECTCHNLPPAEQSLCELFHHMLHSKSCFSELRQISIKKKGFHWVNTETPGEKLSRAQFHSSSIDGETVYIIAYSSCIVLILGIVLLTLLKIRACRIKHETRSPSPDHSSETFMVHYKSHR